MHVANSPLLDDLNSGHMSDRASVRVIRDIAGIEEIRSFWESWQHHPNSDIDFYLSRFKLRKEFIRPHIIVAYQGGKPDAFLVGRLDQGEVDLKVGHVHISRPRVRTLSFLYAGLLGNGSRENSQMFAHEILENLRQGEAQMAVLPKLTVGSPLHDVALTVPGFLARDWFHAPHLHCTMQVPKRVEDIYAGISSKGRKNLRLQTKKLLSGFPGKVEIKEFRHPGDLDDLMRDVECVAKETYQRGLGVGFEDTPETRERYSLMAQKGCLRSYVLYLAGEPAAFWVGVVYSGTAHLEFLGFHPKFEDYSPGTFLVTKALESFPQDGVKAVDFGYGEEGYKQRFGKQRSQEATIRVFRPTPKGFVLKAVTMQTELIDQLLKKALQRAGLRLRLKKAWGRHVQRKG